MIEARHLVKRFGLRMAVDGVSLEVRPGEILGFLGPNGAGKTTTLRMITGFLSPDAGGVSIFGRDVATQPVAARSQLGYLPENAPAYGDMTVEEFLGFAAAVRGYRGADRRRRVDTAIEQCLIEPVRRQTIDTLSKGYRQRTGFAQAILHDPPVLIFDEPTAGLDPNQKKIVREKIADMGKTKAIVLSTHLLEEVEALCTRGMILSAGKVVADGTPAELRALDPAHNGVTAVIAASAEAVETVFRRLSCVREVVVLGGEDGWVRVHLFPRDGLSLMESVLREVRNQDWNWREMNRVEGRLDVVFRTLTRTPDSGDPPCKESFIP